MRTVTNQNVRPLSFYRRSPRRRVLRRPEGIAIRIKNPEHDNPILVRSDQNTGARQKCLENLRPWPKGVSGNPAGRPKDTLLMLELRKFLAGPLSAEEYSKLVKVIVRKVFERAVNGDVRACIEIRCRTQGRVPRIVTVN